MQGHIKKREKKESLEDEQVNKHASIGEKLEISDPLDVQVQVIDFGKKPSDLQGTMFDTIDQAENTSQLIRLFNKNLAKRMEKIKKMKFDEPFSIQQKILQTDVAPSFEQLNSKPLAELSLDEIHLLLQYWLPVTEITKLKFYELHTKISNFMNELKRQQEKISNLAYEAERRKLQKNEQNNITTTESKSVATQTIQNELKKDEL